MGSSQQNREATGEREPFGHKQTDAQKKSDITSETTQRNLYYAIFENASDAIAIVDDLAQCVDINPAACELLGFSHKELLGKTFYELIPGLKYQTEEEQDGIVNSLNGIHPVRQKNGKIIELEMLATTQIAPGRHMLKLEHTDGLSFAAAGDIKTRDSIFATGGMKNVGAWRLEVETGVLEWTGQIYQTFEVERDFQPTLEAMASFCAPGERKTYTTAVQRAIDYGEDFDLELPIITAKGEHRWVSMAGAIAQEAGKTVEVMGLMQDITARKEVELKSLQNQNLLEDLLKHLPGMAYRCLNDETWTMLFVSAGCQALTGYHPDDVLGNRKISFTEVVHPQDIEMVREVIDDAVKGQGVYELTYRIQTVTGQIKWVWEQGSAVYDQRGNFSFLTGFILDITEQVVYRQKLLNIQSDLNRAQQVGNIGSWEWDVQANTINMSAQTYRIIGLEPQAVLVPETLFAMIHPDDQEAASAVFDDLLEGVTDTANIEYRVVSKSGEILHIYQRTEATRLGDGSADKIFATVQDVTDLKQAESALRSSEAILQAAFNSELLGFVLYDADMQVSMVNQTANQWFQRLIGKTAKVGKHASEIVRPENWQVFEDNFSAARHGEGMEFTIELENTDGEMFWFSHNQIPVFAGEGEFVGVFELFMDISENHRRRMQAERQLQSLNALHNIDRAIANSLDLTTTLNVFLDQVVSQLDVDAVSIRLMHDDLYLKYAAGKGFGLNSSVQKVIVRLGEGFGGKVAYARELQFIPDVRNLKSATSEFAEMLREENFRSVVGMPLKAKGKILGVLDIFKRTELTPDEDWFHFLEILAGQAAIAIDNATHFEEAQRARIEIEQAYDTTLVGWALALELLDEETEGHAERVTEMAVIVARRMGFSRDELVQVRRGSLLHDIGKMGIPDSILHKPGALTDEERKVMMAHPRIAYDLLSRTPFLRKALNIPYYHHERWDGSGYPHGLQGVTIPLEARIFAIVDVWDALSSDRPYRKAWPKKKIIDHIKSESGKHFDPEVVEVFLKILEEGAY